MGLWEIDELLKDSIEVVNSSKLEPREKSNLIWSLENLPINHDMDAGGFEMTETDGVDTYTLVPSYELGLAVVLEANDHKRFELVYHWSAFLLNYGKEYFTNMDSLEDIKSKFLEPIKAVFMNWDYSEFEPIHPSLTIYSQGSEYLTEEENELIMWFAEGTNLPSDEVDEERNENRAEIVLDAIKNGNINPLKEMLNDADASEIMKTVVHGINIKNKQIVQENIDVFLSFESKMGDFTPNLLSVLYFMCDNVNHPSFRKMSEKDIDLSENFADWLAKVAFALNHAGSHQVAIDTYARILDIPVEPSIDSGFYTNMLWAIQYDNTKIHVNNGLRRKMLAVAIPKGDQYAPIFFNAVCVYVEMKEYENALKMVQKAMDNNLPKATMFSQIAHDGMFQDFREKTGVLEILS